MDTSEKSIFLYVSDEKVANPVGNLFISDGQGNRFTHSLENIVKGPGAVDFETIESLDGTFIANRYDVDHGKGNGNKHGKAGHLRPVTEEDIMEEEYDMTHRQQGGRMGGNGAGNKKQMQTEGTQHHSRLEELESFDQKIKTYITHNKGSSWELIRAPEKNMQGKSTSCFLEDGCSLHL